MLFMPLALEVNHLDLLWTKKIEIRPPILLQYANNLSFDVLEAKN